MDMVKIDKAKGEKVRGYIFFSCGVLMLPVEEHRAFKKELGFKSGTVL